MKLERQTGIQNAINVFIPEVFVLLDGQNISWSTINKRYGKVANERGKKVEEHQGAYSFSMCFYDIVFQVIKKDIKAKAFLNFLKNLLQELIDNLTPNEKIMVRKILYDMLITFDITYLNYVGELAVLNNLIKSKEYRLVKGEQELGNGNNIDFLIQDTANKKTLVEIVNIHLVESDVNIIEKIFSKIEEKNAITTKGQKEFLIYSLIPVVWADINILKIINDFFQKESTINIPNAVEPCAMIMQQFPNDVYRYYFGTIKSLSEHFS